jgi:hypothetical protein
MPKRMVAGSGEASGGFGVAVLPTWQATGLSMAVIVGHVFKGSGALVFGLLSVGVIWTLHRLHTHAPRTRSTADLIASVPGAPPARAVGFIQFTAYALIGAYTAKSIASMSMSMIFMTGPDTTLPGWSGPALSVTVVAVVAVLVSALPTRLLAPVATVLAALGLLVFFYVALAVIAKVASGTAPAAPSMEIGAIAAPTEWGPAALLISLAIAFAGFEIPTTVSDRLRSVRQPLGIAIALVAVCATTAWVATNMATTGEFRYDAADLAIIASDMFGESGGMSLMVALIAQAIAAMLVLVWGATRVIRPAVGDSPLPLVMTAVVMAALALAVSIGWGDAAAKLWGVAGVLLFVVYVAAAQANSRLNDSNTTAWAWFALMGIALAVVVFLHGVSEGWWPILIAAAVTAAAAWAVKSDRVSPENRTA